MSTQFGKVGVLYGGRSAERDVSLMSGAGVCQALRDAGVDAHLFDTGVRSLADLAAERFERVFIALHGRFGEDGALQGALELLRVPYTGSGVLASALAMDKVMTKRVWLDAGLPTPPFAVLQPGDDGARAVAELGLPLIVKPIQEGSTIGLTRVEQAAQMPDAIALAASGDTAALAERFVSGRELTVALLGSGASARALPVIEIVAPGGNYDYQNKYFTDDTRYLCPAPLPEALAARVRDIALAAYRVAGCEGWARADVMLDADEQPYLLEINTSPGMTGHSLVPMAAAAAGLSYEALCVEILSGARCKIPVADRP